MDKLTELELDLKSCLQMIEGLKEKKPGPFVEQLATYMGHARRSHEAYVQELFLTRKG